MLQPDSSSEPKDEILLIQAISHSNNLWDLIDSCNQLIRCLELIELGNVLTLKVSKLLEQHIEKLKDYVRAERLNMQVNKVDSRIAKLTSLKEHLESERKEMYLQIEIILNTDKVLANKLISMEVGQFKIDEIHPLNLACDPKVVELLLYYGANPNTVNKHTLLPFNLTSLEAACSVHNYGKAISLLSLSQHEIDTHTIDKSIRLLLDNSPKIHVDDTIVKPIKLQLMRKLSEKVSLKCLLELLEYEQINEQETKEYLLSIPNNTIFQEKRCPVQERYDLINERISIYGTQANQRLSLSVWLLLSSGNQQKDNILSMLPYDIRMLIISTLCSTNFYEVIIEKISLKKLAVFKSIAISLMANGFKNELLFSSELFSVKSNCSIKESIGIIISTLSEKNPTSMPLRARLLLLEAWILACDFYENFSFEQRDFITLIEKTKTYLILDTLKKIQTIMFQYNPNLKHFNLLDYPHYEGNISNEDFLVLSKSTIKTTNSLKNYSHNPTPYENIFSRIENKIKEDKQNRVTDTGDAYELAKDYFCNFHSQNKVLINVLAQWVLNTKQNEATPTPTYRATLFSPKSGSLEAIKKDIIKYINDLNDNKRLPSERRDAVTDILQISGTRPRF